MGLHDDATSGPEFGSSFGSSPRSVAFIRSQAPSPTSCSSSETLEPQPSAGQEELDFPPATTRQDCLGTQRRAIVNESQACLASKNHAGEVEQQVHLVAEQHQDKLLAACPVKTAKKRVLQEEDGEITNAKRRKADKILQSQSICLDPICNGDKGEDAEDKGPEEDRPGQPDAPARRQSTPDTDSTQLIEQREREGERLETRDPANAGGQPTCRALGDR